MKLRNKIGSKIPITNDQGNVIGEGTYKGDKDGMAVMDIKLPEDVMAKVEQQIWAQNKEALIYQMGFVR